MIILEGPDGAGKTNLLERLVKDLEIPKGPRASTSVGGPVDNLFEWVWLNYTGHWPTKMFVEIYDRYPLVSEYIYGPIVRDRLPPGFDTIAAKQMRESFEGRSFTIFCMPPIDVVRENLSHEPQMPGVEENIELIYLAYLLTITKWRGPFFLWDYTVRNQEVVYQSLVGLLRDYMNTREELH